MASYLNYSFGYRLSRAASISQVDTNLLALELQFRGITCEFPGCQVQAHTVLNSGVTALVCVRHALAYAGGGAAAKAIEKAIKHKWQALSLVITNAAFEDAGDHVTFVYTGDASILDEARKSMENAGNLLSLYSDL